MLSPSYGPFRRIAASACIAASLAACSGKSDEKKSDAPSADESTPPPDQVGDSELAPVSPPVGVSGTFLYCARDAFILDAAMRPVDSATACFAKDENGQRYESIESVQVVAVRSTGERTPIEAHLNSQAVLVWHFYFVLPADVARDMTELLITFKPPGRPAIEVGETTAFRDMRFVWTADPIFQTILKLYAAQPQPVPKPQPFEIPAELHYIFATDRVFAGDFGADKADGYCQEAGAKVFPDRTWRAIISTPTLDARDKIVLKWQVVNLEFGWLGTGAEGFWVPRHYTGAELTETGRDVSRIDTLLDPPRFLQRVWTGTKPDGTYDAEAGSCNGWTSADAKTTGLVGQAIFGEALLSQRSALCAELARLLCISQ